MNLLDIFLISIYLHFHQMKEKGRQIIPWFQTVTAITLFLSIGGVLAIKLIIGDRLRKDNLSELVFLIGFMVFAGLFFWGIKQYFFNSGKHLTLTQKYIDSFSEKTRYFHKVVSIAFILFVPTLLGYLVWLKAKPL